MYDVAGRPQWSRSREGDRRSGRRRACRTSPDRGRNGAGLVKETGVTVPHECAPTRSMPQWSRSREGDRRRERLLDSVRQIQVPQWSRSREGDRRPTRTPSGSGRSSSRNGAGLVKETGGGIPGGSRGSPRGGRNGAGLVKETGALVAALGSMSELRPQWSRSREGDRRRACCSALLRSSPPQWSRSREGDRSHRTS